MNRSLFQGNVKSSRCNSCNQCGLQYFKPLYKFTAINLPPISMALKFVRKVNVILAFSLRIFSKFKTSSGSIWREGRGNRARRAFDRCEPYNDHSWVESVELISYYSTEVLVRNVCTNIR